MIQFLDGPAAGVELSLRAAPRILRVVRSENGEWDALDQPQDAPEAGEEVFVYVRAGEPFVGFIDYHDGRGRKGEPFINAKYWFPPTQPTEDEVRTNERFTEWCHSVGMWQS